jgi:hypothetical protein
MYRCFALGAGVAHQTSRYDIGYCALIGICSGIEQNSCSQLICRSIGDTQCGVKCRLTGIAQTEIGVCTLFQQKLAQPPVSVECRTIQVELTPNESSFSPCRSRKRISLTSPK